MLVFASRCLQASRLDGCAASSTSRHRVSHSSVSIGLTTGQGLGHRHIVRVWSQADRLLGLRSQAHKYVYHQFSAASKHACHCNTHQPPPSPMKTCL